ncbi:MAG: hypothetical protein RIR97_1210 [Pseudomonadota bacterium]
MRSFRKTAVLVTAAPLLALLVSTASAETIAGAMAKAYANNPDLNAARAGLRATDEGVAIAKSGYRPQVSASASRTTSWSSNSGSVFVADHNTISDSLGITITQSVFDGFQTLNRVKAAEAGVFATREQLRAQEMQILFSAASSYANIARDQDIVSIRKQNLKFLREQLNAAKSRQDVGEGTSTDVSLAQAQLAGAEALLAAAISQLKQSESVYWQIVGEKPSGIRQPAPAKRGIPDRVDDAIAIGLKDHPSVLASLHAVDVAGYNVKTAQGTMLPGVTLQGSVSRNYNSYVDSLSGDSSALTGRLTVPIYQGGAEYGQIRQAKEQLGQQKILVDSARLSVQNSIISSYAQMEAAKAALVANRQQLSAANKALDGVIEERNVGQATTLDVLNTQQNVLNAKEQIAESQRNLVVASYAVIAATGHLTVSEQGLNVAEYDPTEHYNAVKDAWIGLRTVNDQNAE